MAHSFLGTSAVCCDAGLELRSSDMKVWGKAHCFVGLGFGCIPEGNLVRKSHAGMCRRLPQRGCLAELAAKHNEGVGTSVGMNARGFITAKYESKKKNDMEEDKWGGTSH